MTKFIAAFAFAAVAATSAYAMDALTEEQVEGVQKTIKGMDCTVEDTAIEIEGSGYEADDVICKDGRYDVYLDKDFKVTNKVKEE
jgi:hypothetical protein